MPSEPHPYLVVSASGRQLAQAAARSNHPAVVIDWFADRDTCDAARAVCRVTTADFQRFDAEALLTAADALAPPAACAGVIAGAGFEATPQLLERLAAERRLWGNIGATVAAVKDPARFFAALDELGIAHPEVRLSPPPASEGWLAKRIGASGGAHILDAARVQGDAAEGHFYQRREAGQPLSLLFLADGCNAYAVGVSEQLHAAGAGDYTFGGVIGGVELAPAPGRAIARIAQRLTQAFGLVGLNGIDFLLQGDACSVLELNPRPTAALECYDADFPSGLFTWHLRACQGQLPDFAYRPGLVRGHALVYARHSLRVDRRFVFPAWCRDLPQPGCAIGRGEPLCTVHRTDKDAAAVRRMLRQRAAAIENLMLAQAA